MEYAKYVITCSFNEQPFFVLINQQSDGVLRAGYESVECHDAFCRLGNVLIGRASLADS